MEIAVALVCLIGIPLVLGVGIGWAMWKDSGWIEGYGQAAKDYRKMILLSGYAGLDTQENIEWKTRQQVAAEFVAEAGKEKV